MAKNSMNFNASIRLNSSQFKKGVAEVQKSLKSLQSTFLSVAGALGAGLGFSQLISNLKNTAVELSVAKNTLENVSKTTTTFKTAMGDVNVEISNYAENLEWCKKLARDYSQDMVSLISNFAQFHAACENTNLSLENQKLVFESLTKAAAFYHMSADRSRDMMTAITQMMSKGKVSAEELRRQLGNALPGAFNIMAAALGVSTAQLEEMMKKGQVISADVLPKFAAMLNQITKNADFNSLQMSMNQLRNTWYELVDNSGAEKVYKGLIDGANKVLSRISNNISVIKSALKGLAIGILSFTGFKFLMREGDKYVAETEKQLRKLNRIQEKQLKDMMTANGHESYYRSFAIQTNGRRAGQPMPAVGVRADTKLDNEELRLIKEYNKTVIEIARNRRAGLVPLSKEYREQTNIIKAAKKTNKEISKQLGETRLLSGAVKGLKTLWMGVSSVVKSVMAALKANAIMAVVGAILGVITTIKDYFDNIKEETKRIAGIFDEYQTNMEQVQKQTDETNRRLMSQLEIAQDINAEFATRKKALEDINKTLGLTGDNAFGLDALDKTKQAYKDIVNVVNQWIEASVTLAKVQAYAAAGAQAEADIIKKNAEIATKEARLNKIGTYSGKDAEGNDTWLVNRLIDYPEKKRLESEIKLAKSEIAELRKVSASADAEVTKLYKDYYKLVSENSGGDGGPTGGTESDISKVLDKFTKDKKELENKLREHAITQDEYNDELDKLMTKYWEEAAGTGAFSIEKILEKVDKGKALTAMEKWYMGLYEAAQKAAFNIAAKAAAEAIEKATDDALEEADNKINEKLQEAAEKAEKNLAADFEAITAQKPTPAQRDKTFDYKKSKGDIQEDELDIRKDNIEALEEALKDLIDNYDDVTKASEAVQKKLAEWRNEIYLAKKEADTLEEAMKLSKIQEDIDELSKNIRDALFGGIKNTAQSFDRIVKGAESLRDVFEKSDSTGWEKFMAVFNLLIQALETCTSLFQTLDTIQKATAQKEQAEIALETTKLALLQKELELRAAIAAQKSLGVEQTEAQAAANVAEAATAKVAASANASEAVAGAAASGAKIPFPWNLAAIAAGMAAVMAALAAMNKYATGGIVGGNSYSGDKQMARVNSGEMILNRGQQRNLWDIVNGKGGIGGQVTFKLRGSDLIGSIQAEQRKRRG